jgi:hypothetical protein
VKPPPTLEAVWGAVKSAQTHGWTREAIGARLRAAGATWGATGLVACPEHERAGLVSDLSHHPSWRADRARFCATLKDLGTSYDEVCAVCLAADPPMPHPSQVDAHERGEIVASLLSGGWWMAAVMLTRGTTKAT